MDLTSGLHQGDSQRSGAGVHAQRRAEAGYMRFGTGWKQFLQIVGNLSGDLGSGAVHHREGLDGGEIRGQSPSFWPEPWGTSGPCPGDAPLRPAR